MAAVTGLARHRRRSAARHSTAWHGRHGRLTGGRGDEGPHHRQQRLDEGLPVAVWHRLAPCKREGRQAGSRHGELVHHPSRDESRHHRSLNPQRARHAACPGDGCTGCTHAEQRRSHAGLRRHTTRTHPAPILHNSSCTAPTCCPFPCPSPCNLRPPLRLPLPPPYNGSHPSATPRCGAAAAPAGRSARRRRCPRAPPRAATGPAAAPPARAARASGSPPEPRPPPAAAPPAVAQGRGWPGTALGCLQRGRGGGGQGNVDGTIRRETFCRTDQRRRAAACVAAPRLLRAGTGPRKMHAAISARESLDAVTRKP